jgi:hypothetical protein
MAQMTEAQFGYISVAAYRPLYGVNDVVYNKLQYVGTTSKTFQKRPHKVLRVCIGTNAAGAPIDKDDAAITTDVAAQTGAPWRYDIQEILVGETVATASGQTTEGAIENNLATLADIKTYVGTEVGDWTNPSAS